MQVEHVGAFLVAIGGALLLTPLVRNLAIRYNYVSKPREGRWSENTTPVLGGMAIYFSFLVTIFFFLPLTIYDTLAGLLLGGSLIFFVGIIDDLFQISPYAKLLVQIAAACLALFFGIRLDIIPFPIIGTLLTVFWIVGITNAFNLLDNMDGLSAGIACIASTILFFFSLWHGYQTLAILAIALAGSTLGFLRYNFHPAKIFMGDCGSMFLGFSLAVVTILGTSAHLSNLIVTSIVPIMVMVVPIFDTALVTLVRSFSGRPISQGGKDHASHRLVMLGLSEKKAVIWLYGISLLCGAMALFYARIDVIIVIVLATITFIVLFFFGIFLGGVKVYDEREIEELKKRRNQENLAVLNAMLLHKRRIVELFVDFILICLAYYSAYLLKYEGEIPPGILPLITNSLPWIIVLKLSSFFYFGMYHGVWKYIGISDLFAIGKAVSMSSLLVIAILTFSRRFEGYSRAVLIIDWLLLFFFTTGVRATVKILHEYFASLPNGGRRVLILGAGDAGEMLLREIRKNKKLDYEPVGFLDDDPEKVGRTIHGVPILGPLGSLSEIVLQKGAEEILIAIPSARKEKLDQIISQCRHSGVPYLEMKELFTQQDLLQRVES